MSVVPGLVLLAVFVVVAGTDEWLYHRRRDRSQRTIRRLEVELGFEESPYRRYEHEIMMVGGRSEVTQGFPRLSPTKPNWSASSWLSTPCVSPTSRSIGPDPPESGGQ